MDEVRHRLARRLRYRGALAVISTLYGIEAGLLHHSTTVVSFGPRGWLFALAAAAGLGCVARPRVVWLRHVSAMAAVTAPAGRGLALTLGETLLPGTVEEAAVAGAWGLVAMLAWLVWPLILPPHIDIHRFADGLR